MAKKDPLDYGKAGRLSEKTSDRIAILAKYFGVGNQRILIDLLLADRLEKLYQRHRDGTIRDEPPVDRDIWLVCRDLFGMDMEKFCEQYGVDVPSRPAYAKPYTPPVPKAKKAPGRQEKTA